MIIRLRPRRRNPRLLASRMKRMASSQVRSRSRTVTVPFTDASVTILRLQTLANAVRTSASSLLRNSRLIRPGAVTGEAWATGMGGGPCWACATGGAATGAARGAAGGAADVMVPRAANLATSTVGELVASVNGNG